MRCCVGALHGRARAHDTGLSSTIRAGSRDHNIALVWSGLASDLAAAVHIRPEEVQATIGTIGKDVEVFDIITHNGVLFNESTRSL